MTEWGQPIRNVETRVDLIGQRCKGTMEWLVFTLQNILLEFLYYIFFKNGLNYWSVYTAVHVMNGIWKCVCVFVFVFYKITHSNLLPKYCLRKAKGETFLINV